LADEYYKTLGIEPNASAESIKKAYREQAHRYHPDRNPDDRDASDKFREIQKAYETLSDPAKRAAYDAAPGASVAVPGPPADVPADEPAGPPRGQADKRWIVLAVFGVIAVGIVAAILISRSGGDGGSTATAAAGANGCKRVEAPEPKQISLPAPKQTVQQGEKLTAVVQTSCGTFKITLDTQRAPKTTNSFAYLAEEGFYDDLTFHRIVPEFVIQGGDPLGTGTGDPGYKVVEKPPANLAYTKGVVAMAKSSAEPPGTSGSQFYVVTGADAGLPPEYALVGKVSEGLDVVERIGKLGTPEEKPKQTVLIEKITIEKG
jgi:peptidyl-prolyl cis-trans isomerase B (cyclophilin B)